MRRQPEFAFPKSRDRGWWIAIAAALVVHFILLRIEAVGWFWAEGTPPVVQYIQLTPDLPQVDMAYRPPLPPRRAEKRQEQEWTEVARLVGERKARAYDDAVKRLRALRELSKERGTEAVFGARLAALLEEHRSKHAFRQRVVEAGLSLTLYR